MRHHHYHPRISSPHLIALFSFSAYDVRISSNLGRGKERERRGGGERRGTGGRRGGGRESGEGERESGEREGEGGIFNLSLCLGHSKAGSTFTIYSNLLPAHPYT